MIIVTGGAGYIGSHMVKELIHEGYDVTVLDNLSTGHREAVHKAANFVEADLLDFPLINKTIRQFRPQAVLHFAAKSLVADSMVNPLHTFYHNLNGANNLLQAMAENKITNLVLSSTAAVYGEPEITPILESSPQIPTNSYGESKLFIERILSRLSEAGSLRYVSLRYFNAAGADPEGDLGEDHQPETHLIPLVLDAAADIRKSITVFGTDYPTKDGTAVRDYIHINDLVSAHILALEALISKNITSAVYNLGNETGHSVLEIINAAKKITGADFRVTYGPRRAGDPSVLIASSEKIKRELGWAPRYFDLETIIKTAWIWKEKHPGGYRQAPRHRPH